MYNTSGTGFDVSENGKTGSSVFLFDTADGTISGWSPSVDSTNAIVAVTNPGAIFTGLAIATDRHGETMLYAADFAKGTIEVYNQSFQAVTNLPGSFTDPKLPAGYAPFNIQAINNKLYVEYAPAADVLAGTAAPGEGAVDVYNADGQLQERLIRPGNTHVNQPWAVAMAPGNFGSFSDDLLVGNFGDGHINAYNPRTGRFVGELKNAERPADRHHPSLGDRVRQWRRSRPQEHAVLHRRSDLAPGQVRRPVPRRVWLSASGTGAATGAMTVKGGASGPASIKSVEMAALPANSSGEPDQGIEALSPISSAKTRRDP